MGLSVEALLHGLHLLHGLVHHGSHHGLVHHLLVHEGVVLVHHPWHWGLGEDVVVAVLDSHDLCLCLGEQGGV